MSKLTKFLSTTLMVLFFISIAPQLIKNIKNNYQDALKPNINVATITINNEITDTKDISKQIIKHFKDDKIKAILFEIDSQGGYAGSSQAIFNEIQCLKKDYPKPTLALTTYACCSAAYYIACASDHIIASSSALVGSIGSTIGFFNVNELLKKYNVNYINKSSGDYKTAGSPFLANNLEQEKMLQELSDSCYSQFTNDVASCRKLALKDISLWANGRVFTGEQALKLGLIDETGSRYNAIKKIKELAQIKDSEEINWVKEAEPNVIAKFLNNKAATNLTTEALVDAIISKLQSGFISCN